MPRKILIVEDNVDYRHILRFALQPSRYEIVEAANGFDGIDKALAEMPDLIIMDLGLPEMDGIQTTVKLKQDPRTTHIPVVAYTVWGEEFREKAMEAGMVAFLPKTTPVHVLSDVIGKFLPIP